MSLDTEQSPWRKHVAAGREATKSALFALGRRIVLFEFESVRWESALALKTRGKPAMNAFILVPRFVCPGDILAFVNAFVRERCAPETVGQFSVSHLRFAEVSIS